MLLLLALALPELTTLMPPLMRPNLRRPGPPLRNRHTRHPAPAAGVPVKPTRAIKAGAKVAESRL